MISVSSLSMRYGGQMLFEDATFQCRPNQRFGISGKNGAGKSTLLRVFSGEEEATTGEVSFPQDAQLGMLKQDHFQYEDWSLLDTVIAGKPNLWSALKEKDVLLSKAEFTEEDGIRLGDLEAVIAHENGYEAESIAHTLLSGLGIEAEKHSGPMRALSGGFKLRVLLAQVLFQNPTIMLLDEPTNHLDITSIHWLEQYLTFQFEGILLFVSHDKHFMNAVATHILDVDFGTITSYTGNYDAFVLSKALLQEQAQRARTHEEAKIDHLKSFVDKFGAKASKAKQARSKQKQIDKMELTELKVSNRAAPYFNFKQKRPSGKSVLKLEKVCKAFGELQVLKNIGFELFRGEKVAIIGANGMGKSTLLKIVMDQLKADAGEHEWGYETQVGYFAQDHDEQLQGDVTVFTWLEDRAPPEKRFDVRRYLGQMLFSGDTVKKKLTQLSGGEAARLVAAGLMITEPNVLVMDEPTNHLDLEALTALGEALKRYDGSVLFVSHDRDFVRMVATRIIVLTPEGLKDITAGYDDYLDAAGEDYLDRSKKTAAKPDKADKKKSKSRERDNTGKQEAKLEREIASLENEILTIDAQMGAPEFYQQTTPAEQAELQKERDKLQEKIDEKLTEWENLTQN